VKVLFDENIPRRLRRFLTAYEVRTAAEQGWSSLENGSLLQAAEAAGFLAMITADQGIVYQQNMTRRTIALLVLDTNDWRLIEPNATLILQAIKRCAKGSFELLRISQKQ